MTPREVLEINDTRRRDSDSDNIVPLSELKPGAATPWGFSRPTMVPGQGGHARLPPSMYAAAFADKFPVAADVLRRAQTGGDLKVVVAGGAAAWPLGRRVDGPGEYPGDIDFFIHNSTEGAARADALDSDLRAVIGLIIVCAVTANPDCNISMYKTKGVVTFMVRENGHTTKIQVVAKDYRSVSEILHGFDVGSCCIAYDGVQAVLSTFGAWSYLHSANIVHPLYRSPTYEARLVKYFKRGWMLVIPDLDTGALAAGETLRLPHMHLECESVNGNFIRGQPLAPGSESASYDPMMERDPQDALHSAHEHNIGWLSGRHPWPVHVDVDLTQRRSLRMEDMDSSLMSKSILNIIPLADFERLMLNASWPRNEPHSIRSLLGYGLTEEQALSLIMSENQALMRARSINPAASLQPFLDRLWEKYTTSGPIDWWIREGSASGSFSPRSETPAEWYGAALCLEPRDPNDRETIASLTAAMAKMHTDSSQHKVFSDGFCALCQGVVVRGDPNSIILPCGHIFHWTSQEPMLTCHGAKEWVAIGKNDCPQCRQPWENLSKRLMINRMPPVQPVDVEWRA